MTADTSDFEGPVVAGNLLIASDAAAGTARWRVLDDVIHRQVDDTHPALEWRVTRGCLPEAFPASSHAIFRRDPDGAVETQMELESYAARGRAAQDGEMPSLTIDSMNNAAPWSALAPDGVTPSTELSLTIDNSGLRPNADPSVGLVSGSLNSLNHFLRRSFAAIDLTQFNELRFWVSSNRAADGTAARPLFLEFKLASVALPFDNPGNTWQRYVPVSQARTWEPVRFSLGDLPGGIRSAATQAQFRVVLAGSSFQCYIDDILAVVDHMIGDVDAALLAQLNGVLVLAGQPVPAVLHPANGKLTQTRPYFEITNFDIVYSRERTDSTRPRGDYSDRGFLLRQGSNAYELYYQVTAVADDRASQAQMLEFVLRTLPARGELVVNGLGLPMESVSVYAFDQVGGVRTDALPLFYRISTRQPAGPVDLVAPVKKVVVDGDLQPLA